VPHGPHGGWPPAQFARNAEGLIRAELAQQLVMILAAPCERVAQAGHLRVTTKTLCLELGMLRNGRTENTVNISGDNLRGRRRTVSK
jgi:hypothetical protein